MGRYINKELHRELIGQVFGKLTVQLYLDPDEFPEESRLNVRYLCACACGQSFIAQRNRLLMKRSGVKDGTTAYRQVDCGCGRQERRAKRAPKRDLTGQVFGRLTVISWAGFKQQAKQRHSAWLCHCACGVDKAIQEANLLHGGSLSCGCLQHESNLTHGLSNTPFSRQLACFRFLVKKYPAKTRDWPSLQAFKDEMYASFLEAVKTHGQVTIDPRDPTLPFGPGNAVWVPKHRRFVGGHKLKTFTLSSGEVVTQLEAIRRSGVSRQQFWNRLHGGLTPEEAMQPKPLRLAKKKSERFNIDRAIRLAKSIK